LPFKLFTVLAITLAFALLTVGHLFLALALDNLPLSRIALTFAVELRGCMLHGLANSRERMTGTMRRTGGVLSVGWGLVRTSVGLAEFCQTGKRVTARLTGVVGTCRSAKVSL
jgi:hypothetical protein